MEQLVNPFALLPAGSGVVEPDTFDCARCRNELASLGAITRPQLYEGDDSVLYDFTATYQPVRRHSHPPPLSLERILRQGDELLRMHDSRVMRDRDANPPPPAIPHEQNRASEFALQNTVAVASEPPPQPLPMAVSSGSGLHRSTSAGPQASSGGSSRSPYAYPDSSSASSSSPPLSSVIACQQCRRRKVRCDSIRPACGNCLRRKTPEECVYDAVPRRRGPDKNPGTRNRPCKPSKRVASPEGSVQRVAGGTAE
ncbi:hypothetical protein C8F01DRAFT_447310 [Mycena amicta]|nr:hypothetical protein C8F01DRAFT_447310 [Mycena amicta]